MIASGAGYDILIWYIYNAREVITLSEPRYARFEREYGYSSEWGDDTDEDRYNRTFNDQDSDRKDHEFVDWADD